MRVKMKLQFMVIESPTYSKRRTRNEYICRLCYITTMNLIVIGIITVMMLQMQQIGNQRS